MHMFDCKHLIFCDEQLGYVTKFTQNYEKLNLHTPPCDSSLPTGWMLSSQTFYEWNHSSPESWVVNVFMYTNHVLSCVIYIGLFEIFYVTIYEVNLYLQNNIYLSRSPDRGDNCARNILPGIWFNFFSQIHKILWVINGSKQHFVFLTPCLGLSKYYFLSKIILSKFMADNVYT